MAEKYVITAAQASYELDGKERVQRGPTARLHEKFYEGLESFAAYEDAELIVLGMRGKDMRETEYHESLRNISVQEPHNRSLNRSIGIKDMVVPPQNVDATTGRLRFAQRDKTSIYAHPKQRLRAIPSSNSKLPKMLITTGSCTHPNYAVWNHRGDVASRDHTFGAVMVEVIDDNYYNVRHINAFNNGRFLDMGWSYDGSKTPQWFGADSLVLGDLHVGDTDPKALFASYEMIEHFGPKNVVVHDLFNGHSVNPHERFRTMKRTEDWRLGRMNLEQELESCSSALRDLSSAVGKQGTVYVVRSNHDEFLDRYLDRGDWLKEPWNADIALRLAHEQANGNNPLEKGVALYGGIPKNVVFLSLDSDLKRWGFQLGSHGHKGNSGSRGGNANSRETAHGKSITGHSHTPEVLRDTVVVGTMTDLNLPYTDGSASSWMHANAVLYPGGKAQLLPIINGKWKAKE